MNEKQDVPVLISYTMRGKMLKGNHSKGVNGE